MFNWVLSTGIRRTELIQLTLAQLPDGHVAPRVDGRWPIKVVGKGGKTRTVYATDDLIAETRSYWDNERKSVLRSKTALSGPDQIFLSHTSGEPISARQVNRVFKDAFIDSTSKLHTHRVRAKFATDFVNENVDAEVEKVNGWRNVQVDFLLDALAQILGHCDKRTLRRYVQVRLRWHAQGFGKLERARGV
ncbi:site-specific integrase [Burkholderia multivorans]|nr:site-specific integrase [Burkholderia multivorans]